MQDDILKQLDANTKIIQSLKDQAPLIEKIADEIINAYSSGKKVIVFGNGGSAADAQHIAAEFVGKYYLNRPGLEAIALTTNSSIVTAVGNDYGFDHIFERQINTYGKQGDIAVGISTSGKSKNIIYGLEAAKQKGLITMALIGQHSDELSKELNKIDYVIYVPSKDTPRIQEAHITLGHIICGLVEKRLFGNE